MANYSALAATALERADELAQCTEIPGILKRTFMSEPMQKAHGLVRGWMQAAGMAVRVDALGNLIGRLPGRHPEAGAVLLLAHWDHFGTCAQPPAEHLICNGAIDNASGVAALTELARRLSKAPQAERDIYFLATTAEELGLLGAEAFAENPPLPLERIVAAFNLDSVALAPRGTPLGIVGKGLTRLDAAIAQVAREQRRKLADGAEGNRWLHRQDGWALIQHDVPAVMVTSTYGDLARLEAFFDNDYHRPSDVVKPGLELGGMAEDVAFHVALARWFADPKKYGGAVREAGR